MNTLEVAERAAERGGPGALALVTRERSLLLRFAASRPTQSTGIDDVTIEIAVPLRGNVGRASTNAVDDESLADCAARARLAAEAAEAVHDGNFPGFDPYYDAVALEAYDPATAELDPAVRRSGPGRRVRRGGRARRGGARDLDGRRAGPSLGDRRRRGLGVAQRCVHEGDLHRAERPQWLRVAGGRRGGRTFGGCACRACCPEGGRGGESVELPPGEYPVVFEPQAVGWLLDLLGETAFNGLAHAEGRGALAGRMREPVAAPAINLSDSPTSPRTLPRTSTPRA